MINLACHKAWEVVRKDRKLQRQISRRFSVTTPN